MCRAIDDLRSDQGFESRGESRIIYYYCTGSRLGEARSDKNLCLLALIRQLARKSETARIEDIVQSDYIRRKVEDPEKANLTDKECENMLKQLVSMHPHSRITIVIDALDECDGSRYLLLTCLTNLVKCQPRSIRLFLSSQLHIQDEALLSGGLLNSIGISPAVVKHDMEAFINKEFDDKLNASKGYGGILEKDEILCNEVKRIFKERAASMSVPHQLPSLSS